VALRHAREKAGMSLREVAAETGLHYTYISKVELGATPPPHAETIVRLAKALDADADALLITAEKVPPDLEKILSSDIDAVRLVRQALKQR
jgi:transcriptional regulator with XRE-family HTH domain